MKKLIIFCSLFLFPQISWSAIKNFTPVDAVLDEKNPDTNISTYNNFTMVKNDAYLMQFDLSSIKGQAVSYAHLYIWDNKGFQHTNNIYRMVRNFTPDQTTWNNAATGTGWNTPGALNTSTDYTSKNTTLFTATGGSYQVTDVTALVNDCLTAGNICNLMMRSANGEAYDQIDLANNVNHPSYLTIVTGTSNAPNLWYVRDGGGNFGQTVSTCNGSTNTLFNGSNGPNCAVNSPNIITGKDNKTQWVGGDIMYIDGDSDTSYAFTVSGVTTGPSVGDEYTNNGITYTVTVPLPAGQSSGIISMSGSGAPTSTGNLTVVQGHGSSPIVFSAEGAAQAMYKITSTLSIPEGASLNQPTKIIGTGNHWPQIWGDGVSYAIDASGSYIDMENLDITNHDNCIKNGPIGPNGQTINPDGYLYVCGASSNYSANGILWGGTGLTMKNINVHNFEDGMNNDISKGIVGNITLTNVKVFGNNMQGAIIGNDQAGGNVMTGVISLINSQVDFNGCGQRYPLQDSADIYKNIATSGFSHSVDDESNYYNCWGAQQHGYGDGYGFGDEGGVNAGNWTIIGSSVSFNTQDGVDTLHGNGNGTYIVLRSKFEGNAGQQLKPNGHITYIENNVINGDCARWVGAPETSTTYGATCPSGSPGCANGMTMGDICRAVGDTILLPIAKGSKIYFYGNTVASNAIAFETSGSTCDSTTAIHLYNNIIFGGGSVAYDGALSGNYGNEQLATYIYFDGSDGNGSGTCGPIGNGSGGVIVTDEDYNMVYNMKHDNSGCTGQHDICGKDPGFIGTIPMGSPSGEAKTYYHGTAMATLEFLSSPSAARGTASAISTISPLDYYGVNRGTKWDIGAIQADDTSNFKK